MGTSSSSSSSSSGARASSASAAKIAQLRGMGFGESSSRIALEATNGNVDAAVDLLIQQGPAATGKLFALVFNIPQSNAIVVVYLAYNAHGRCLVV
jgi:hypothetical protein